MFASRPKLRSARLSIAPLLDMIFILLIFFVVTTTFSKMPGVSINRPEGTVVDKLPPNNLIIGVTEKGEFYINKKRYTLEQLESTLSLKVKAKPNLSVVIMADKEVALKYVVQVMDACKKLEIDQLAIAEEINET